MKRLLLLVAIAALAAPAAAQHHGHPMPMPKAKAQPKAKPAPKAPARKPAAKPAPRKPAAKAPARAAAKPTAKRPAPKPAVKQPAKPATDPHAGHQMEPAQPSAPPPADPHAGHAMPAQPEQPASDPHAGHDMSAQPQAADPHVGHAMPPPQAADPHAGHAMPGMAAVEAPPAAPPPPEAFLGPEHAAATIYEPALFERKRQEELIEEHGGMVTSMLLADQLEYRLRDGRDGYKWDVQGWYGGDYDKLWIKSEGEGAFGDKPEQAELQLLYSRAIDPWFNLQAGVRHDFRPDPERSHLVLGVQGLAPYWFEIEAMAFLSNKGDLTARFEAEYDQRITQKLILQPLVEFDLAAQDVPELGIGAGLSSAEIGARLRYEFVPEFAPYIGVEYERSFGGTARFARAAGEEVGGWSFLIGLRSWF